VLVAMTAAPCTLWPQFFDPDRPSNRPPSTDCLPSPNIVIVSARQTR
jgi:hypothetical protein